MPYPYHDHSPCKQDQSQHLRCCCGLLAHQCTHACSLRGPQTLGKDPCTSNHSLLLIACPTARLGTCSCTSAHLNPILVKPCGAAAVLLRETLCCLQSPARTWPQLLPTTIGQPKVNLLRTSRQSSGTRPCMEPAGQKKTGAELAVCTWHSKSHLQKAHKRSLLAQMIQRRVHCQRPETQIKSILTRFTPTCTSTK